MNLKDLMNTTPERLAETQEKALKDYAVTLLREIANMINVGKYDEALNHLSYSPGGDDMGTDNRYIEFDEYQEHADLGDVLDQLLHLRRIQDPEPGKKGR